MNEERAGVKKKMAPPHKRKCSTHLEELEKRLEISLMPASPSRKPSFADCVSSARRPSCEGLATTASPRHGTHAVAASAGRSERHGSYVDEGEGTGLTEETVEKNRGGGAEVTSDDDGDDDVDDVSLLRELTRQQDEDLRMAAMIGQKLLDTQEELHAELEAMREEQWLVNCEKDALKRDLERATRRCEQMQSDATLKVVSGDPPEEFELWSPAAATAAAAATIQGVSPSISPSHTASGFATATADEVTRLHQLVKSLELANGTLNEKLIESHLEANALRRASDDWRGQIMLDQKEMAVDDKTGQERQLGGMAAAEESGRDKPWVDDTPSACGLMLSERDQQRDRSDDSERLLDTDKTSKDGSLEGEPSLRGPGQNLTAQCSSSAYDRAEADRATAETFVDARGGEKSQPARDPGYEPDEKTPTPSRVRVSTPAVMPSSPSRVLKRFPSISEGPDEQAELIDALRGQVDQLRLETQRAGSATSSTGARRRTRSAELQDSGRSSSKHSSDEDSSSDNGNGNGDDGGNDSGRFTPCRPPVGSLKTAGEESSTVGGGNVNIADGQTIPILQARVRDLSAELLAANLELVTLREQAQTDQAEIIRLQRENLSSHRLELNSAMVAAAAARASATANSSSAHVDCQRCGYSPCGDENNGCLNLTGLRWLHRLWLRLANGLGCEQGRNREAERFCEERWKYGSEGYNWGCKEDDRLQFDVDERASLLPEEEKY